jgi:phosphopantetheinyl transferase
MTILDQWDCTTGTKLYLIEIPSVSQIYEETGTKHTHRDMEAMAVDQVVNKIYTNHQLCKDEFGKPYLFPKNSEINYSHTQNKLFWGNHRHFRVGVDIETLRPQLSKIKLKFCREDELAFIPTLNDLPFLLAIWSCKESIYKAYGKKEVDFRDHMKISPFKLGSSGKINALLMMDHSVPLEVHYKWDGTFFMSWTILKD